MKHRECSEACSGHSSAEAVAKERTELWIAKNGVSRWSLLPCQVCGLGSSCTGHGTGCSVAFLSPVVVVTLRKSVVEIWSSWKRKHYNGNKTILIYCVISVALDCPAVETRWGVGYFSPVQTGPRAHPAPCTLGTESVSRV